MPGVIRYFIRSNSDRRNGREGLASHKVKNGTPTMGGIVFILVPILVFALMRPAVLTQSSIGSSSSRMSAMASSVYRRLSDRRQEKNNEGGFVRGSNLRCGLLAVVFFLMYRTTASTEVILPLVGWRLIWRLAVLLSRLPHVHCRKQCGQPDRWTGWTLRRGEHRRSVSLYHIFTAAGRGRSLALFLLCVVGSLLGYLRFNLHPAKRSSWAIRVRWPSAVCWLRSPW